MIEITPELQLLIDQRASDLFEERRKEIGCFGCGLAYGSEGWIEAIHSRRGMGQDQPEQ